MANETKKIYRSSDDLIIAGVANGLARYFEIDTTLVRLIFILLTICGGSGVLIYLVLWLIIPKEGEKEMKVNREKKAKEFAADLKEKAQTVASEIKDEVKSSKRHRGSFFGLILVILGAAILVQELVPVQIQWDYVWPGILIFLGLYLMARR
jgi:phage shock protein PspC (stress-responsive transcriptional regulator)